MTEKDKKTEWEETIVFRVRNDFLEIKGATTIETREWIGAWMNFQIRYISFKIHIVHEWELIGNNSNSK